MTFKEAYKIADVSYDDYFYAIYNKDGECFIGMYDKIKLSQSGQK